MPFRPSKAYNTIWAVLKFIVPATNWDNNKMDLILSIESNQKVRLLTQHTTYGLRQKNKKKIMRQAILGKVQYTTVAELHR